MKRYMLLSVTVLLSLWALTPASADQSKAAIRTLSGTVANLHQATRDVAGARGLEIVSDNVGAAGGEIVIQGSETRIAIRLYRRRAGVVTVAVTADSENQSRSFLDLIIAARK